MYLGYIDWLIVLALSLAAIPFSYLGARLALSLRDKTLVRVYGFLLALRLVRSLAPRACV